MDPVTIAMGLASVAPSIIKWITGDEEAADTAQKVVTIAQAVTGSSDPEAAVKAVKADPAAQASFQAAWQAHELALYQAQTERLKAELSEVANARSQTVDLARMGSAIAWGAPVVSLVVVATFGVMLYVLLSGHVADGNSPAAQLLLGTLVTAFGGVVQYWTGSSAGSADKTKLLAMAAPLTPSPQKPKK